jgi:hypothetical protein
VIGDRPIHRTPAAGRDLAATQAPAAALNL